MLKVPAISLALIANFFASAASAGITTYMLTYINLRKFDADTYGNIQLGITLFGGFFCNILYAVICDKLEPRVTKIKPNVCCFQMILQSILMFSMYNFELPFWAVMLVLATNTFFCTGYFGPSMAIMSASAP